MFNKISNTETPSGTGLCVGGLSERPRVSAQESIITWILFIDSFASELCNILPTYCLALQHHFSCLFAFRPSVYSAFFRRPGPRGSLELVYIS